MKKIVFFSKNLEIGGMEKSLVALINELSKFYDATLILEKKEGLLLNQLSSNVKVLEYKLANDNIVFIRKIKNLTKRLKWTLKNYHKYDFSCNYATYSIIGSKLAQISSKNKAYYIHSDYYGVYNGDISKIKNFFRAHNLQRYNHIIFVSNESKNNLLTIYPKFANKFVVINNLIDYKDILIKAQNGAENNVKIINNKYINFAFIGRLDNTSKNLDLLINSFIEVSKKSEKYKLFIIGNGPYRSIINSKIQKNKLQEVIYLIDETDNPYQYLTKCDVLILTSNYEGFPVVYLEALVLNKDIMTTIITSDESINMKDYSVKLNNNGKDISEIILKYKKSEKKYNVDFDKLNKNKIDMIRDLIER